MIKAILKPVTILAMILVFLFNSCKKESEESVSNRVPVITDIEIPEDFLTWESHCQICVEAMDPEGKPLTFSWDVSNGSIITPTHYSCVTWEAPPASGDFICTVYISDSINTTSREIKLTVHPPSYLFEDDFSSTTSKWSFDECEYGIENEKLILSSTNPEQLAKAKSFNFNPYRQIPWTISGQMAIEHASGNFSGSGLAVHLNDVGDQAIQYLWFEVRRNDADANWALLMYISDSWWVWDDKCYGVSPDIYTDGRVNDLKMHIAETKQVTLTANGITLMDGYGALNEFQNYSGNSISTSVIKVILYGGTQTKTQWDNICFYSTHLPISKSQSFSNALPPPEAEITKLFNSIEQGNVITLKNTLQKKLQEQE